MKEFPELQKRWQNEAHAGTDCSSGRSTNCGADNCTGSHAGSSLIARLRSFPFLVTLLGQQNDQFVF